MSKLEKYMAAETVGGLYFSFKRHDELLELLPRQAQAMRSILAMAPNEHKQYLEEKIRKLEKPFGSQEVADVISKAGLLLGNLTAAQSLARELNPGEIRASLCSRTRKKFASKKHAYLRCDAKLDMALSNMETHA